jgi:glycosyltransferase involved in cell wall biosynthesis
LSRRCRAAIAVSKYVADNALKYLSDSVSIHVLYNIIDFNKFRPGVSPPNDLIKNDGELWFGMIGAVTPLKGQDLFLDAAIRVIQVLPNARFLIVGTNFYQTEATFDYEKELKLKACSTSLNGYVRFLGFRDDIPAVLSCLDILIQPNRGPEGLGRSILEAMASGVPVISVDKWGPSEIIENNKTGLFYQYMNIEDLAEKMILLGAHEKMRKEISDCACKWIHRHISSDYIGNKFSEIIMNVLTVNQQQ